MKLLLLLLLGVLVFDAHAQSPDSTHLAPADSTRLMVGDTTQRVAHVDTLDVNGVLLNAPVRHTYIFTYAGSLTGNYAEGAVSRLLVLTTHNVLWGVDNFTVPLVATYSFGKQSGVLKEREIDVATTPTYKRRHVKFYLNTEYQTSNLRLIDERLLLGGGVGYAFYKDAANNEITLSNLLLHEHTAYGDGTGSELFRSSTRLKLRFTTKRLVLNSATFYQPALTGDNHRISSTNSLSLPITPKIAAVATYLYTYESIVVPGRSKGNTAITGGISCTIK